MTSRSKPYTTNQETWKALLQKPLRIPMNQRQYSWGIDEITLFLNDMIDIFEKGIYIEKMGSIINLKYKNNNDIYDGQQRILTTNLILNVLGCLLPEIKEKNGQILTIDKFDRPTEEQTILKEKYNVELIPKIYCINPYDMKALIDIFNNKIV